MHGLKSGVFYILAVIASGGILRAQDYTPLNVNLDIDQGKLDGILTREMAFEFKDKPLKEFAAELADYIKTPVFIDERALAEEGVNGDSAISLSTPGMHLELALTWVLKDLDLTWRPGNDGLIITSSNEAAQHLITRVYPVYDLVVVKSRGRASVDFDSLIEVVTSSIEPDQWEENGGEGTIEPFNGSLLISQTWQLHRMIERTFAALRASQGLAPNDWDHVERYEIQPAPQQLQHRTYLFPVPASAIRTHQ